MKTTNFRTSIVAVMMCAYLFSCEKEINKPVTPPPPPPPHVSNNMVKTSSWFSANWQQGIVMQFIKDAPELNNNFITVGKVLVFGKGGFGMKNPTALPSSFDGNFIGTKLEVGDIKFVLEGGGAISPSLQFRYIIIPPNKLVLDNSLDYKNYHAVCSYYRLAE